MPSVLLVTALLIAASTTAVVAEPPKSSGWLDDVAAARARAQGEGKPILVDLWADWCTWCKRLEQDVFATPRFQDYAKQYVLLRVDTEDGGEGTRLMEDFEVESLPTTLLLSHDLIKIGELQGYLPADAYVQSLELETALYRSLVRSYDEHRRGAGEHRRGAGEHRRGTGPASGGDGGIVDPVQSLADELHARRDGARAATLYRELIERGGDNAEEMAWNHFYFADSLRLGNDFDAARRAAETARKAAAGVDNAELLERIDLLSFYLARDAAACAEARQAIDRFIAAHPGGALVDLAREEQRRLKSREGCA